MLNNCPQREDLLRIAMGDLHPSHLNDEQHLRTCARCQAEVAAIREDAAKLVTHGSDNPPEADRCLDESDVAELVEGSLEFEHRAVLVAHTASCATCREHVAALARLLGEPTIRRELDQLHPTPSTVRSRRYGRRIAGVVAAAAVVALLMPQLSRLNTRDAGPSHRAGDLSLSAPPVPVAPLGVAEASTHFEWSSTPLADRYEITLYDDQGTILWQANTTDTIAVLPDSVILVPGASYFWKSRARIAFDRWTDSDLVEFSTEAGGEGSR